MRCQAVVLLAVIGEQLKTQLKYKDIKLLFYLPKNIKKKNICQRLCFNGNGINKHKHRLFILSMIINSLMWIYLPRK